MIIHTHARSRAIKRTLLAVGILLFLSIAGGIAYVYYSGLHPDTQPEHNVTTTSNAQPVTPAPTPPGPDAPNGASVQYLSSPVALGDNANIVVTTGPEAACVIVVAYGTVVSHDSGLRAKTADIHGSVSWTWTVEKGASPGKWPVKVTCTRNKKVAYVEGTLEVTK